MSFVFICIVCLPVFFISQCGFELLSSFPGGSDSKESTCSTGDTGLIPELGRSPGGGNGNPLQYSCLENPHGQRSLVGYSPWRRYKSDTTEWLSTHGIFGKLWKNLGLGVLWNYLYMLDINGYINFGKSSFILFLLAKELFFAWTIKDFNKNK